MSFKKFRNFLFPKNTKNVFNKSKYPALQLLLLEERVTPASLLVLNNPTNLGGAAWLNALTATGNDPNNSINIQLLDKASHIAREAASSNGVVIIESDLIATIPQADLVGSLVIPIDGSLDVVSQITTALEGLADVPTLRIISHGADGALWFGNQRFDTSDLNSSTLQISAWGKSLTTDADILLYGCSIASTDAGKSFVEELARLTQSDIAASTNLTGKGGDENLEFQVGQVTQTILGSAADYNNFNISLWADHFVGIYNINIDNFTNNNDGTAYVIVSFTATGDFYSQYNNVPNGPVYLYLDDQQIGYRTITAGNGKPQYIDSVYWNGSTTVRYNFPITPGTHNFYVAPNDEAWFRNNTGNPITPAIKTIVGATFASNRTSFTCPAGQPFYDAVGAYGTPDLRFSATGLPSGLSISSSGTITGTPVSGSAGVYPVVFTVTNGFGTSTFNSSFTITNAAPSFVTAQSAVIPGAIEDTPFTLTYATLAAALDDRDINGDTLSFRIDSVSSGSLSKNGVPVTAGTTMIGPGESLVFTSSLNDNGQKSAFTVSAYDGALYSGSSEVVRLNIAAVNDAPVLSAFTTSAATGAEDTEIQVTFASLNGQGTASDIDGTVVAFVVKQITSGTLRIGTDSFSATPWNATTNSTVNSNLNAYWTPALNANGSLPAFKVVAKDNGGLESIALAQVSVSVTPVNDAPVISKAMTISGLVNNTPLEISYDSIAAAADESDVEGDVISFRIAAVTNGTLEKWNGSAWAAVVPGTTLISAGEKVRWSATTFSSMAQNAFTIKAWDGQLDSSSVAQIKVDGIFWASSAWTNEASSGIDPLYRYTHAYNFGSTSNLALNGVPFTGVAGGSPSVAGQFSTTNFGNVLNNDPNNLSGASRTMANDFIFNSGRPAASTITLNGLTPGARYVLSMFSVGYEAGSRNVIFQSAMGQFALNQDAYGDNNGIRVDYQYLADSSGNATISINGPYNFHFYGFANREFLPSMIISATTNLVYDGAPKSVQALATAHNQPFISAGDLHTAVLMSDGTVTAYGSNTYGQCTVPAGLNNVVAVSAGGSHTLALKSDGTVVAWGLASYAAIPAGLNSVVAISAGKDFSLALQFDGTVVAWGNNSQGQLNLPEGLSGVIAISAGNNFSLALRADGTVITWGSASGVSGTPPVGLKDVVAISAGNNHSLALKSDGTVVAWGVNSYSQASVPAGLKGVVAISAGTDFSTAIKADGTVVAWGSNSKNQVNVPYGLSGVMAIDAGGSFVIAVKSNGTLVSWGDNSSKQLYVPTVINSLVSVAPGNNHTLGLKSDGTVVAWGDNTDHQCDVPVGLTNVTAIAAGDGISVALKSDGTVVTWGYPMVSTYYGGVDRTYFPQPAGLTGVVQIVANGRNIVALKSDGTMVGWGLKAPFGYPWTFDPEVITGISTFITNSMGAGLKATKVALGDGFLLYVVPSMTVIRAVSFFPTANVGYYPSYTQKIGVVDVTYVDIKVGKPGFGLAVWADGTIQTWGGADGIGTGSTANIVNPLSTSVGYNHGLILKSDGSIVSWGVNNSDRQTVVPESAQGVGVIKVFAGAYNSYALKSDGTVVAWGVNSDTPAVLAKTQFGSVGVFNYSYNYANTYTYSYQGRGATVYAASNIAPTVVGDYTVTVSSSDPRFSRSVSKDFSITKPTPAVTYTAPSSITYGTQLTSTSTASKPGTWVYSNPNGQVLNAGTYTLSATFTPTDTANYSPITAYANITVNKATVAAANISINAPSNLTYNGSQKSYTATASGVAGVTLSYSGKAGTSYGPSPVAPTYAGNYTVTAVVADPNYQGSKSLDFVIAKANPTIATNPVASAITYGQTLAASSLTGATTSVPGTFAFTSPATPDAGTTSYSVTFTPSDSVNYNSVVLNIAVIVTPSPLNSGNITFTAPASLVYSGAAKAFTALASGYTTGFSYIYLGIAGTTYPASSIAPINAGNYSVTATVTSANYSGSAIQTFAIAKATPSLYWNNPANISYGTSLSASQLNASTVVPGYNPATAIPGAFIYTPASGTILQPGTRTLTAVFYPTDTANYTTATKSVPLQVGATTVSLRNAVLLAPDLTYDGTSKPYMLSQMAAVSGGQDFTLAVKGDGTVLGFGDNSSGQINVPAGLSGVLQVAAGRLHSVALKLDGTIVAWGSGGAKGYMDYSTGVAGAFIYGQGGQSAVTGGVAIAAGTQHTLVLKSNGTVVGIGYTSEATGDYGSLHVTYTPLAETIIPAGLSNVIAIAAGDRVSVALKSDGTVVAWGDNPYGAASVPAGLSGVVAISASYNQVLALKSDGTVVAWGTYNNGATLVPVPTGLSNVIAIAAGRSSSYALKSDGSIIGWGGQNGSVNIIAPSGSGIVGISENGDLVAIKSDGTMSSYRPIPKVGGGGGATISALATGVGYFEYSFNYSGRAGTTYSSSSSAPVNAGDYHLVITSTNVNIVSTKTIDFTIAKVTPTINSIPFSSIINEGQALSSSTLASGSASVPGTFAFTSPSIIPGSGANTQSVTFTPTDAVNYNSVTTNVVVNVQGTNALNPIVSTLPTASPITYGQRLELSVLTGGSANVPGTFV